jgi:hypothetical protein
MVALLDLWLPILLSAVFVFIASSVLHMVIPIHKGDYGQLPNEDELLAAMRDKGVKPGSYMFPFACSMKEMASDEMLAKMNQGPMGFMTVNPNGPPAMGKSLAQWFVFSIVLSVFVAYIGTLALPAGTDYMRVFRVTGTIAVLGYGVSSVPDSIWKGVSWKVTAKFLFDGAVYGLVTAGAFGWLWPGVAS